MRWIWAFPDLDCIPVGNLEDFLSHLSLHGYCGIEPLIANPYKISKNTLRQLAQTYQLPVTGLRTGLISQTYGVTFSHPDEEIRGDAVRRLVEVMRYSTEIGYPRLLVGLLQGRAHPDQSVSDARMLVLESLMKCAQVATRLGVEIDLESLNKQEADFNNCVADIIQMIQFIGEPSLRLLADTYHMQLEENSIVKALIYSQDYLGHVHFSDTHRLIPGMGEINFREIIETLKEINYLGDIAIEIYPGNPYVDSQRAIKYLHKLTV